MSAVHTVRAATAFAPATVANVAVGIDLLGHSIEGPGDRATVRRTDDGEVRIVAIRGCVTDLPKDAAANTAGRALLGLLSRRPGLGFELELDKGIALGSGMGGSAASAVAALVAANALLDEPLSMDELYELAVDGEVAASGGRHGDNVAPSLLGGLVIAPQRGAPVRVPAPELWCAVVHPDAVLLTRDARAALAVGFSLQEHVVQSEGLALVLAGCYGKDHALIARGLRDVIAEPRRAPLIRGFQRVKRAALDHGALGASISGAGPSVFAWLPTKNDAERAASAMVAAFSAEGLSSTPYLSPVAGPAAKVESCTP